jgi:hypothetical protein
VNWWGITKKKKQRRVRRSGPITSCSELTDSKRLLITDLQRLM